MRGSFLARLQALLLPSSLITVLILFAQCSYVPPQTATMPEPPAHYGALISTALSAFKGFADYRNFQISNLRWVDATTGWGWLACVRFDDHGRERYYSFFIVGNAIVNARYDVRTDQCAAQQYLPFDVTTGTVGTPTPILQQPIY
jgi:hypothetical protein